MPVAQLLSILFSEARQKKLSRCPRVVLDSKVLVTLWGLVSGSECYIGSSQVNAPILALFSRFGEE